MKKNNFLKTFHTLTNSEMKSIIGGNRTNCRVARCGGSGTGNNAYCTVFAVTCGGIQ